MGNSANRERNFIGADESAELQARDAARFGIDIKAGDINKIFEQEANGKENNISTTEQDVDLNYDFSHAIAKLERENPGQIITYRVRREMGLG